MDALLFEEKHPFLSTQTVAFFTADTTAESAFSGRKSERTANFMGG